MEPPLRRPLRYPQCLILKVVEAEQPGLAGVTVRGRVRTLTTDQEVSCGSAVSSDSSGHLVRDLI